MKRMGRTKLSKLQKQILVLALENRVRERREFNTSQGADVYYSEILTKVYRFPPTQPLIYNQNHGAARGHRIPGGWKFNPAAIGQGR